MKSNNSLLVQALVLALALIGTPIQPASAGFPLGNAVTMGGEPVFSIKEPAYGYSPEHRAQLAQDNLDNALAIAPDCDPSLVRVERINGTVGLTLNGHLVATPDSASAAAENLSVEQLGQKWADGIKSFLTDHGRSVSYRNSLIGIHPIQASIAYTERRLYAPEGLALPVIFDKPLSAENLKIGDVVRGTISQDVPIGHFLIPSDSVVSGTVVDNGSHQMAVAFNELKTPNGTETPIRATISSNYCTTSAAPHPVCTLSMPAGLKSYARLPAMIAIGAPLNKTGTEQVAFEPGSHFQIAAGQEVSVILSESTPVALVERNIAM
jgi:hypothetical protein